MNPLEDNAWKYKPSANQPWNLSIPLETRIYLLKKQRSFQHKQLQFECEHSKGFENEECNVCGFECPHYDMDEGVCLMCGYVDAEKAYTRDKWEKDLSADYQNEIMGGLR